MGAGVALLPGEHEAYAQGQAGRKASSDNIFAAGGRGGLKLAAKADPEMHMPRVEL